MNITRRVDFALFMVAPRPLSEVRMERWTRFVFRNRWNFVVAWPLSACYGHLAAPELATASNVINRMERRR